MKDGAIVFFIGFGLVLLWLCWDTSRPIKKVKPETVIIKRFVKKYHGLCGLVYEYKEVTISDYYCNDMISDGWENW